MYLQALSLLLVLTGLSAVAPGATGLLAMSLMLASLSAAASASAS